MVRYGGVLSEYHRRARSLRLAVCAALLVCHASALDRTRVEAVQWAPTAPPRGWSSWNSFQYNVTAALVRTSADAMVSTGLLAAGYEYVLLDDGWPLCAQHSDNGSCARIPPRDADGRIVVDPLKFPNGFQPVTSYVHSLGLKIGLHHEAVDAQAFADWGFDFIKHDTCAETKPPHCGIHDGCMQNSTAAMRAAIDATGRRIVYYVDSGNPTSPQMLYNPQQMGVAASDYVDRGKLATSPRELAWVWLRGIAHMWKSWFDIKDTFENTLSNAHNQIRTAEYQTCGGWNMPDMLTVGQGGQSVGQYRAMMSLWSILGAPLIAGNDIRNMSPQTVALLTAPEVLEINADADCVQGSFIRGESSVEVWIRPLAATSPPAGGAPAGSPSFAVVMLNKDPDVPRQASLYVQRPDHWPGTDFFPAMHGWSNTTVAVRDVWEQKDVGTANQSFAATIPAMDAKMFKVTALAAPPS